MGIIKFSLIPTAFALFITYLWYTSRLSGYITILIGLVVTFLYTLIQCYRYGMFDRTSVIQLKFPAFKYYYKEYQCDYGNLRKKAMNELSEEDHNMLKSKAKVNYFAIYYDDPKSIVEKKQCRACAGFALRGEAEDDIGINKVLEVVNFIPVQLNQCDAMAVKLPNIDDLSNQVALFKTMNKMWEYSRQNGTKSDQSLLFQWEENKELSTGVFTGKLQEQYMLYANQTMDKSPSKKIK